MRTSSSPRNALTLFEVVVSMAIFSISLVPILQLVTLGTERAIDVKLQSRTSMLCQSKLSEVIVGAQSMTGGGGYSDFPDQKDVQCQWKLEANETTTGLYEVKVWVRAELSTGKVVESHLCRMVLDPTIRGSTLDPPPTGTAGTPTPNTDGTTTPATNTPATNTPAAATPTTGGAKTGGGGTGPGTGTGTGTGGGGAKTGGGTGTGTGTGTGGGGAKTGGGGGGKGG